MGRVAHPQMAVAVFGGERHEQHVHALIREMPAEFGEFAVVADQHADRPAVGLDRVERVAADNVPVVAFARGRVNLGLLVFGAVAQIDIGDVLQVFTDARRVRTGDDVDIELHRQRGHELAELVDEIGQALDRRAMAQFLVLDRQQLDREQLGEDHEVRLGVRGLLHEVGHDLGELVEGVDRALAVLNGGDTHRGRALQVHMRVADHVLTVLVFRVAPEQVGAVAHGGLVRRQVVRHHPEELIALIELKAQHRVADLLVYHRLDIGLGAAVFLVTPFEARQPPGKDDALEPELHAQRFALAIEPLADAQAAGFRVHADLVAVEIVAVGIVRGAVTVAGDPCPGMRAHDLILRQAQRRAVADHGVFVDRDQLAFREVVDLAAQLVERVIVEVGVGALHHPVDCRNIRQLGGTNDQARTALIGHGQLSLNRWLEQVARYDDPRSGCRRGSLEHNEQPLRTITQDRHGVASAAAGFIPAAASIRPPISSRGRPSCVRVP